MPLWWGAFSSLLKLYVHVIADAGNTCQVFKYCSSSNRKDVYTVYSFVFIDCLSNRSLSNYTAILWYTGV